MSGSDFIVIGGGNAGLCAASPQAGHGKVAVIEDRRGAGANSAGAAPLIARSRNLIPAPSFCR